MFRVREGPIDGKTALSEPGFDADGLFKLAAESLPSGVLVVAGDGTIVFVNAEVERQCRYTREELVGQPVEIVLPKALPRASQMGAGRELFGRRSDGSEFPVEIGLNPIETPHGTFVLATMVDLTARKPVDGATGVTVEDQLEFERLVAESSATFINVPADRVGDAIRDALRRIGEALDLDWCTFCRVQPDGLPIDPVSWAGPGFPPTPAAADGTPNKEALAKIAAPVYGFYAGNDARINATLPKTTEAMTELKKTFDPVTYEGAGHGFMRLGEAPEPTAPAAKGDKEADDKAAADYQKALVTYKANKKARDEAWVRWKGILAKL